jgi:hypothetical protein
MSNPPNSLNSCSRSRSTAYLCVRGAGMLRSFSHARNCATCFYRSTLDVKLIGSRSRSRMATIGFSGSFGIALSHTPRGVTRPWRRRKAACFTVFLGTPNRRATSGTDSPASRSSRIPAPDSLASSNSSNTSQLAAHLSSSARRVCASRQRGSVPRADPPSRARDIATGGAARCFGRSFGEHADCCGWFVAGDHNADVRPQRIYGVERWRVRVGGDSCLVGPT